MGAYITTPTKRARIKIGSYNGDGTDDRNINIGINLVSKTNVWVIVKQTGNVEAAHRPEMGQGDLTCRFNNAADLADVIQALTTTGFQVGTNAEANTNGSVYRYIVLYEE
jgi:hypothetical protein